MVSKGNHPQDSLISDWIIIIYSDIIFMYTFSREWEKVNLWFPQHGHPKFTQCFVCFHDIWWLRLGLQAPLPLNQLLEVLGPNGSGVGSRGPLVSRHTTTWVSSLRSRRISKRCRSATWAAAKMGVPTNVPQSSKSFDHLSIETHGFGDPPF